MNITLGLTLEETHNLLNTLGSLPTSTGVYPLLQKLLGQAQAQAQTKQE